MMKLIKKFVKWCISIVSSHHVEQHHVEQIAPAQVNSTTINVKSRSITNDDKIRCVVSKHFPKFIKWPSKHYNAQLKLLSPDNPYPAKANDLSLAADYFKRNRSRLFEWWCMNCHNELTSDAEFMIQYDLSGFNHAFEIMCRKKFDIEVHPDKSYKHGVNMINVDGSVNFAILDEMIS